MKKSNQSQANHRRILSMPSSTKLLFPKPTTYTPAPFRSLTPSQSTFPKISTQSKGQKSIEHFCLSPEISLGLTHFSKVKVQNANTKSEFLFKILNKNVEIIKKSQKIIIPVNNPPKFVFERKKNLGYSRLSNYAQPKQTIFNNSFNSFAQNSSMDQPKLMNSTQNEIFSAVPQVLVNKQEPVQDNIVKKLVIRPKYSRFIYDPVDK